MSKDYCTRKVWRRQDCAETAVNRRKKKCHSALNAEAALFTVSIPRKPLPTRDRYDRKMAQKTIGNRLTHLMTAKGVSNAKLAQLCKVTRQSVIHWRKPAFKRLDSAVALIICDKFQVNLRWLVLGEGEMAASPAPEINAERLTSAMQLLDSHLQDSGLRLAPEKKGRAIAIIYQLLGSAAAGTAEPAVVKNVLRLVA